MPFPTLPAAVPLVKTATYPLFVAVLGRRLFDAPWPSAVLSSIVCYKLARITQNLGKTMTRFEETVNP